MVSKAFQTVVLGVGGAVGLYYTTVGFQMAQVAREEASLLSEVNAERSLQARSEAQQQVEQAAVSRLQEQLQLQTQDLRALEAELDAARARVSELEELHSIGDKAVAETWGAIEEATSRLGRLVKEVQRHREKAAVAQQACSAAHLRVEEKRLLLNPLNHPMLRGMAK